LGLRYGLEKEDFRVHRARNVAEGIAFAPQADLFVLDVRLPDGDGFDLCRQLRQQGLNQPILMLTARDELIDKVIGLEVGADDYMTKPFELRELVARIRALLRRTYGPLSSSAGTTLHFGDLELDLASQRVMRADVEIFLTSTEFKLLSYLAHHPDQPQDRETLIEQVWGYEHFVGDARTVDVHVRNLRRKLEPNPQEPQYIVTVRGSGYKLAKQD
jgi:DNA-binding response OmpR family regulator